MPANGYSGAETPSRGENSWFPPSEKLSLWSYATNLSFERYPSLARGVSTQSSTSTRRVSVEKGSRNGGRWRTRMKRTVVAAAGLMVSGVASRITCRVSIGCSAPSARSSLRRGERLLPIPPSEVDVPEFVIVDVKGKLLSTTKASEQIERRPFKPCAGRTVIFIYKVSISGARSAS